jgi:DMSO/TMAO reductase YedYZ heme-binding membrane subunit
MTSTTPAPESAPPASTLPPRTPLSVLAIVAFAIVVVQSILYFTTKTIGAAITNADGADTERFATVMGVLGILSLLPPVAAVVLGHMAIRQTRNGQRRGRILAIAAVALGYLHIAMWANRILVAIIASTALNDTAQIVPNIFWWA